MTERKNLVPGTTRGAKTKLKLERTYKAQDGRRKAAVMSIEPKPSKQ